MIKKVGLLLLSLSCSLSALDPVRCVYPVVATTVNNEPLLLVLDQQSLQAMRLWSFNPTSGESGMALMFIYSPYSINLLPSGNGFSFINNGCIRVKEFLKRSARALNFYEPIYHITQAQWLDDQTCYFSAKQDGRYKIFTSDIDEELAVLVDQDGADCVYPSAVQNAIYFLTKDRKQSTCLMSVEVESGHAQELFVFGKKNVAFLQMVSSTEGFYVETPFVINTEDDLLQLQYCRVCKDGGSWRQEQLFSFQLPMHYIFGSGPERFFESIMPFLPRVYPKEILFSSMRGSYLDIFSFDRQTGVSAPAIEEQRDTDRFGALMFQEKVFYGTSFREETDFEMLPLIEWYPKRK